MSNFVYYPPGLTTRVPIQTLKSSLAEATYDQGQYFLAVVLHPHPTGYGATIRFWLSLTPVY